METAFSTLLNLFLLPFPSQIKAHAQLRVSGLFPSAYWCGQALVDVPLFWALMCLMFVVVLLFNRICPMQAFIILPLVRKSPSLIPQCVTTTSAVVLADPDAFSNLIKQTSVSRIWCIHIGFLVGVILLSLDL